MHALASLALIWSAVFLASITARWSRLTPVVWFLFFGALMGVVRATSLKSSVPYFSYFTLQFPAIPQALKHGGFENWAAV